MRGRPLIDRVSLSCTSCGAPIVRRVTDAARNKHGRFFCDAICAAVAGVRPRRGQQCTCAGDGCGATFYRRPGSDQRFCSNACTNRWNARRAACRTCVRCGTAFRIPPSQKWLRAGLYCSNRCQGDAKIARPLDRTHNGRPARLSNHGYVYIYEPTHPKAIGGGWVLEHRHVCEQRLARYLERGEHVHHVNGDKSDNRPENLRVLTHSEHSRISAAERRAWRRDVDQKLTRLAALEAAGGAGTVTGLA